MITQKQIEKFVKIRNKSAYSSNIQFFTDLAKCGIEEEELGEAKKIGNGWKWELSCGMLTEIEGRMEFKKA